MRATEAWVPYRKVLTLLNRTEQTIALLSVYSTISNILLIGVYGDSAVNRREPKIQFIISWRVNLPVKPGKMVALI